MYPNFEYEKWALSIQSKYHLDGGGQHLALTFERYIKNSKLKRPYYDNLLEMGCGPAWIGLWLHHRGYCRNLTLSDINPQAIHCVNSTIKNNELNNVQVFHSNLFNDIPRDMKFDCIVFNPPNYYEIQHDHILGFLGTDLRACDAGWKLHRNFYKHAARHLSEDGTIFITEVAPYDREVIIDDEVYDRRPAQPMIEFVQMTVEAGLEIVKADKVSTKTFLDDLGVGIFMLQVKHKGTTNE